MSKKTIVITLGIIAIAVVSIITVNEEELNVTIDNGEVNVSTANEGVSVRVGDKVHVSVGRANAEEIEIQTE